MIGKNHHTGPRVVGAWRGIVTAGALGIGVLLGGNVPVAQAASAGSIRVGGSGGAMPTIELLAAALKHTAPELSLVVVPGLGSGDGLNALVHGKIDVALSGRALTKSEEAQNLVAMEYARTPFALVTSKKDIAGLTLAQVADIYAGTLLKWPDGTQIRLVIRPANDVDMPLLASFAPAVNNAVARALKREGLINAITDDDILDRIERHEGGLGASALSLIVAEKRPLYALSIDGVAPTVKNLADGAYRYYKPFYIVTRGRPSASVTRLVDFVYSEEGRRILADTGHWAVDPKRGSTTASR